LEKCSETLKEREREGTARGKDGKYFQPSADYTKEGKNTLGVRQMKGDMKEKDDEDEDKVQILKKE